MNVKINKGHAVTELTEDKGEWRIKRNGANVPEDKLKQIMRILEDKK